LEVKNFDSTKKLGSPAAVTENPRDDYTRSRGWSANRCFYFRRSHACLDTKLEVIIFISSEDVGVKLYGFD